jgi:hypothetical protein
MRKALLTKVSILEAALSEGEYKASLSWQKRLTAASLPEASLSSMQE